jgi:hypothetical protein
MTRSRLRIVAGLLALAAAQAATAAPPNPPSQICIDDVCAQATPTVAQADGIKWHPGHYVWVAPSLFTSRPETLSQILAFIDSIANEPTIKGIQIIGYWGQFEGATAGDYSKGFATVDAILARCAQRGKYLMLSIMPTNFGDFPSDWTTFFPAYIVNGSAYGITEFTLNGTGLQARIWQQATSDRLIALTNAYGARYNSHPNFEMLTMGETSVNVSQGVDGYTLATLDTQLRRQMTAARAAFPNTAVRLGANWYGSDSSMVSLLNLAAQLDFTLGGPDVLPDEVIQANEAFAGALAGSSDLRGILPFLAEIQSPELGGKEGTWTSAQLYAAVMRGTATRSGAATGTGSASFRAVQPQYFVWYHNTWSGGAEQQWSTGTLPFIRSIGGAVYSTSCPTGYAKGCNTK